MVVSHLGPQEVEALESFIHNYSWFHSGLHNESEVSLGVSI